MADDDMVDESDTTVDEFNAMWERATPVRTIVRQMSQPITGMAPTNVTVKARWSTDVRSSERSETASAYARAAG